MEPELRKLLAGFDTSVVSTLAANDVRSVEDVKLLSQDDLKELGFTLGVRNRLLKIAADANPSTLSRALGSAQGSVKDLLSSGLSAVGLGSEDTADLAKFKASFSFGDETSAALDKRNELYPCWDTNDNGFLSLAEVDLGIKTTLIGNLKNRKEGERIWKRFRKSYIRAFVDAADAAPQRNAKSCVISGGKRRTVNDDDFITRREFRLLICYLTLYATMYELFSLIDGNSEGVTVDDDNRISRKEWIDGIGHVHRAGKSWAPFVALPTATAATFDEIDSNHGGYIVLTEFCEWIEKAEKAAGTPIGKLLGVGE